MISMPKGLIHFLIYGTELIFFQYYFPNKISVFFKSIILKQY